MAQRKLKIALSSSLADPAALAAIWFDNQLIQNNLSIPNSVDSPLVIEHTFEATGIHTLKVAMINDFFDTNVDLNLIVNYVALSNENGEYPAYTYLITDSNENNRTVDNAHLVTMVIWHANESLDLTIDTNNPITWFDTYQYDIDNPSPAV
jgi:hypothetical protein